MPLASDAFPLDGKVVVASGTAEGIGEGIARAAASFGAGDVTAATAWPVARGETRPVSSPPYGAPFCLTRAMAEARPSDFEAIRLTLALYCQLCDDGRFDEWAELYTTDATFSVMGHTYTGPVAIKDFIEAGMPPEVRGKHMCANSIIEVDSTGNAASARTDFVFVGRTGEGLAITQSGRYHDTLAREAERWLLRSRQIVFMGDE